MADLLDVTTSAQGRARAGQALGRCRSDGGCHFGGKTTAQITVRSVVFGHVLNCTRTELVFTGVKFRTMFQRGRDARARYTSTEPVFIAGQISQ